MDTLASRVSNSNILWSAFQRAYISVLQDSCHDLAWILDAAIAHSRDSPEQGPLKPAHMASMKKFFQDLGADRVSCLPVCQPSHLSNAAL